MLDTLFRSAVKGKREMPTPKQIDAIFGDNQKKNNHNLNSNHSHNTNL